MSCDTAKLRETPKAHDTNGDVKVSPGRERTSGMVIIRVMNNGQSAAKPLRTLCQVYGEGSTTKWWWVFYDECRRTLECLRYSLVPSNIPKGRVSRHKLCVVRYLQQLPRGQVQDRQRRQLPPVPAEEREAGREGHQLFDRVLREAPQDAQGWSESPGRA